MQNGKSDLEVYIINDDILPINQLVGRLSSIAPDSFFILGSDWEQVIENFTAGFKRDLWIYLEYPYIDKVYRDSYYTYFSTKHSDYNRNSIRVVIFEEEITLENFQTKAGQIFLQSIFAGAFIINPQSIKPVGRSMIARKAFKSTNFIHCMTKGQLLVNGVKLTLEYFPHCTQNNETMKCAETTLWSIMEYFGSKYDEYNTVLPSNIRKVLKSLMLERQIPSNGLKKPEITFALKEFGFGVKTYGQSQYKEDFHRVINYYIESGIPIIASITGKVPFGGKDMVDSGHAVILVGHEVIPDEVILNPDPNKIQDIGGIRIFDTADYKRKCVTIDNNCAPYHLADLDNLMDYAGDEFQKPIVRNIIVPLYTKIYLDAPTAREFIFKLMPKFEIKSEKKPLIMRFFLTSSRSFKERVGLNVTMSPILKNFILLSSMPRFIYVAELSDSEIYVKKQGFGMIAVDATEPNYFNALLFVYFKGKLRPKAPTSKEIDVDSQLFDIYINNLM